MGGWGMPLVITDYRYYGLVISDLTHIETDMCCISLVRGICYGWRRAHALVNVLLSYVYKLGYQTFSGTYASDSDAPN